MQFFVLLTQILINCANSDVAVVTYINKKVIDVTALIKFCKFCEIWESKSVSIEFDDTQITNAP